MKHLILGLLALSYLSVRYKVVQFNYIALHKNALGIYDWVARIVLAAIITSALM